jgi:hypothetical protein
MDGIGVGLGCGGMVMRASWCGPWLMVDMDWDGLVECEFFVLYVSVVWLEGILEVFTEPAQAYFYGVCLSLN